MGDESILSHVIPSYWVIEYNYCQFFSQGGTETVIRACWMFIAFELFAQDMAVLMGPWMLSLMVGAQLSIAHDFLEQNQLPETLKRAGDSIEGCMGKEGNGYNTHSS